MSQNTMNPNCPCTHNCSRHGDCAACSTYHKQTGSLTACEKLEKSKKR